MIRYKHVYLIIIIGALAVFTSLFLSESLLEPVGTAITGVGIGMALGGMLGYKY